MLITQDDYGIAGNRRRDPTSELRGAQLALLGPWVLLMLGICIALGLWQATATQLEREDELLFEREAEQVTRAVDTSVAQSLHLLRGLQALFHASNNVSRLEFNQYVRNVDLPKHHPGVRAIQFARLVARDDKAAFIDSVRRDTSLVAEGYPSYHIKPAGDRAEYVVVEFNEPMTGNEAAFGHDQAHEKARRVALERARDSASPTLSAPITLVQERNLPGFVMRMPVYRGGEAPRTIAQRRAAYVGQLSAVFVAVDFFKARLPEAFTHGLSIAIEDQVAHAKDDGGVARLPIYTSGQLDEIAATNKKAGQSHFMRSTSIEVAGRTWVVTVRKARPNNMLHPIALTVFAGAALIALLVFAVLKSLLGRTERATAMATRMTKELRASAARLKSVVDTAVDGILVFDQSGQIESLNPAAERLVKYAQAELLGQPFSKLFVNAPDDTQALPQGAGSHWYVNGAGATYQVGVLRKDGSSFAGELTLGETQLEDGNHITGILRDVSERNAVQDRMRELALHDALTGLPNRSMLNQKLDAAIEQAQSVNSSAGLLFIDLDRFKWINDTLGHESGDLLLCEVARRLVRCVRRGDTVARTGGDEFVIVMPNVRNADECAIVARMMIDELATPIAIKGHEILASPSIGIALYPQDAVNQRELMKRADASMYLAKASGRNNYQVHSPAMSARAARRTALESALVSALESNALEVFYQPISHLNDGKIVGAEAFLRLNHPQFGVVRADEIIPIAEETGLIVSLGEWVLEQACKQALQWRRDTGRDFQLAVNVSPRQFGGRGFPETIHRVLEETAFPARHLTLDVSEGIVTRNVDAARAQLSRLRECGVRLAFDNFGTGALGAELIQTEAFDAVKIDRSIVRQAAINNNGAAVLRALVTMARDCSRITYAEGVESPIQLETLREAGCVFAQGYLIGAPVQASEFTLRTHGFELAA